MKFAVSGHLQILLQCRGKNVSPRDVMLQVAAALEVGRNIFGMRPEPQLDDGCTAGHTQAILQWEKFRPLNWTFCKKKLWHE